jgi:glycopeptide antibiotics resistance protein
MTPNAGIAGSHREALARLAYIGLLFLATLTPFQLDVDISQLMLRLQRALDLDMSPRDAVDAARNVALFAGWGLVWVLTSRARNHTLLGGAAVTGLALSVGIEAVQLIFSGRHSSILDVITNTGGALVGAAATVLAIELLRAARGRRSFVGVPAFVFAASYLTSAVLEALFPLMRQTVLPGAYGGPFARLAVSVDHFNLGSLFDLPALDLVLFAPAGALAVAAIVELDSDYRRAGLLTAAAGFALMALAELARGFLGQRMELGPLLVHCAAISLGAWAAAAWLPRLSRRLRGPARPAVLLTIYAVLLSLWSWRPFDLDVAPSAIAAQLALNRLVPLQSLAVRVELFSISDVFQMFFLFVPVGALLAVWPLRHRGPLSRFLPAFYAALLFELGQIFINGRYFDITDFLVAGSACMAGWLVGRRAGFAPYGQLCSRLQCREIFARGRAKGD